MAKYFRFGAQRATAAHGDRYKNFMGVARGHGYAVEKHFYTTEDDYINCAFRLPGPRGSKDVEGRPVMLL